MGVLTVGSSTGFDADITKNIAVAWNDAGLVEALKASPGIGYVDNALAAVNAECNLLLMGDYKVEGNLSTVSYTHLTLPTTPYV